MLIRLTHNMEIAHRLFLMPGKCQQIHGHSMQVQLDLFGYPNKNGIFESLDFGDVKKAFREHIDKEYDHRLLLNVNDPWARMLFVDNGRHYTGESQPDYVNVGRLPGLVTVPGDPTTENLVKWVGQWAAEHFKLSGRIYIQETGTNGVGCPFMYNKPTEEESVQP